MIFGEGKLSEFRLFYSIMDQPFTFVKCEELKEFDLPLTERKAKFLEYLAKLITHLEHFGKLTEDFSEQRERMESKAANVPEASRLERLMKYSASLERDFDRTLKQLERLQRMRKGQPVPPPLNLNVTA